MFKMIKGAFVITVIAITTIMPSARAARPAEAIKGTCYQTVIYYPPHQPDIIQTTYECECLAGIGEEPFIGRGILIVTPCHADI